eukprot:GHVR01161409.1.p1 GENE.GHVR01161409.1~~GHVR01161409.1.p1  ORF type:complete len:615 (+),score=64.66 GHVR01161409.1:755-2599(+)
MHWTAEMLSLKGSQRTEFRNVARDLSLLCNTAGECVSLPPLPDAADDKTQEAQQPDSHADVSTGNATWQPSGVDALLLEYLEKTQKGMCACAPLTNDIRSCLSPTEVRNRQLNATEQQVYQDTYNGLDSARNVYRTCFRQQAKSDVDSCIRENTLNDENVTKAPCHTTESNKQSQSKTTETLFDDELLPALTVIRPSRWIRFFARKETHVDSQKKTFSNNHNTGELVSCTDNVSTNVRHERIPIEPKIHINLEDGCTNSKVSTCPSRNVGMKGTCKIGLHKCPCVCNCECSCSIRNFGKLKVYSSLSMLVGNRIFSLTFVAGNVVAILESNESTDRRTETVKRAWPEQLPVIGGGVASYTNEYVWNSCLGVPLSNSPAVAKHGTYSALSNTESLFSCAAFSSELVALVLPTIDSLPLDSPQYRRLLQQTDCSAEILFPDLEKQLELGKQSLGGSLSVGDFIITRHSVLPVVQILVHVVVDRQDTMRDDTFTTDTYTHRTTHKTLKISLHRIMNVLNRYGVGSIVLPLLMLEESTGPAALDSAALHARVESMMNLLKTFFIKLSGETINIKRLVVTLPNSCCTSVQVNDNENESTCSTSVMSHAIQYATNNLNCW